MESNLASWTLSNLGNHIGKLCIMIVFQVFEACEHLCLNPLSPSHPALSKPPALLCEIPVHTTTSCNQSMASVRKVAQRYLLSENLGKGKKLCHEGNGKSSPSPPPMLPLTLHIHTGMVPVRSSWDLQAVWLWAKNAFHQALVLVWVPTCVCCSDSEVPGIDVTQPAQSSDDKWFSICSTSVDASYIGLADR